MEILGRVGESLINVAVEMGVVQYGLEAVGGVEGGLTEGRFLKGPTGEMLDIQPVSVGNPHCVCFREEMSEAELVELGPFLTSHPVFPEGANVQLARVSGEGRVEILIWERGVGRTSSSGTSACAVASACVERGMLQPGRIQVLMEGGDFFVTVTEKRTVRLEGPIQPIMEGEMTPEMQKFLLQDEPDAGC
jgi:diaminopimelate epimerase